MDEAQTPIGTYSGKPMHCTEVACHDLSGRPTGEIQKVYGEEIPEGRDLTSGEFFQLVKQATGFKEWPEALSLKQTRFDLYRDQAELIRAEGNKLIVICWTTYFRKFNRRYVNGLTLEVAKTVPLAIDQVGSDIADSVKVIVESIRREIERESKEVSTAQVT